MLTAHRQEPQSGAATLASDTHAGGFAKVLTSIQGLQERLDGFSVEEASQAEANVYTVIQQLSTIQEKLSRVIELKHAVSSANWMIGEIPEQNFEQVDVDRLEDHPQLHAIIQASKLIRVHKLMQAAKAGVEVLSFGDEAPSLQIQASGMTNLSTPVPDIAGPSPLTSSKQTGHSEMLSVALESPAKNPPEGGWVFSADAELDHTEPHFVEDSLSVLNDPGDQSADQKILKVATPTGAEATVAIRETGFDERLLSDLIQAYGEFAPVLKSSSATSPPTMARIVPAKREIPSSVVPSATAQEISTEREPSRETSAEPDLLPSEERRTDSSHVIPLTREALQGKRIIEGSESTGRSLIRTDLPMLPEAQTDRAEPKSEHPTLPNNKRHGELDRQLKNIIKDYGEYDLYSHQSSTNVKKAALAAFAVLALVLGILYFFKAPSTARNPASSSVTQSPENSKAPGAEGQSGSEFKTKE